MHEVFGVSFLSFLAANGGPATGENVPLADGSEQRTLLADDDSPSKELT
jgi:hypothetical protein